MIYTGLKSKVSGIYCIKSLINGKIYIGSATNIFSRFRTHKALLNKQKHFSKQLQHHVNKHGLNSLKCDVLEYCEIDKIVIREQFYLDTLLPFDKNGFNTLRFANVTLGYKRTPESIEATARVHRGKILSTETKLKISIANKGRKHTSDVLEKYSQRRKGITLSESQKQNQSIEMLNRNPFGKLVLNIETGIYYDSGIQAANAHNIHAVGLNRKLRGERKNRTQFILA
jgi:group I intron endonuclease